MCFPDDVSVWRGLELEPQLFHRRLSLSNPLSPLLLNEIIMSRGAIVLNVRQTTMVPASTQGLLVIWGTGTLWVQDLNCMHSCNLVSDSILAS